MMSSETVRFGFRPEAWLSLLAPTCHLYVFRIPVRTSIIPRTTPHCHHPQGYKTLMFAPVHLRPKETASAHPHGRVCRPPRLHSPPSTRARPSTHLFVADCLNLNPIEAASRSTCADLNARAFSSSARVWMACLSLVGAQSSAGMCSALPLES
jgi:hypothetical protein